MTVQRKVVRRWQALSKRERRVLRAKAKGAPDPGLRLRIRIILSLVQGNRPVTVCRGMGASNSQVYRVAGRFIEEGPMGLADRRQDNGEEKVTEEYETLLLVAVAKTPRDFGRQRPTWTQELLILVMEELTGIRISTSAMSRLLARLKVGRKRARPTVGCPWPEDRKIRRLNQIRRLVAKAGPGEIVLYADEVDIDLNPRIGLDWMLRGQQKQVPTPGKNQKRYLAGALDPRTGEVTFVEHEKKNSDLFILLMWELLRRYPHARRIHLIVDNYSIHNSQRTQLALASAGRITLHFLPPYCPDHNKIERVWKDLHDNVTRNHRCADMDELMNLVRAWLEPRCPNAHIPSIQAA